MLERHNPEGVCPPFSTYSHAVAVPPGARLLYVSGQIGIAPDGSLAEGEAAQHEQAWRNVLAMLEAGGMGPHDIVRVNAFVTRPQGLPVYREVRDRMLSGAAPASTLLVVAGLAHPDWLVEIEVVAAKAG